MTMHNRTGNEIFAIIGTIDPDQQTTAAGKRKSKQKRRLCATAPEEEFEVLSVSGRRATHV